MRIRPWCFSALFGVVGGIYLYYLEVHKISGPVCLSPPKNWLIVANTPQLYFLALLLKQVLEPHEFSVTLSLNSRVAFHTFDIFIVLGANTFPANGLPPADRRIVVQLEQASSPWFKESYLDVLRKSYAVLEYNQFFNIEFLKRNDIHDNLWYVPLGGNPTFGQEKPFTQEDKLYDLLFYGDLDCKRRQRMVADLKKEFNIKVVSGIYGPALRRLIRQARFVINLHYYIPASLEVYRLYESLSEGTPVISEDTIDRFMYPDFGKSVTFFKSPSSLLSTVHAVLEGSYPSSTDISAVVTKSYSNFIFFFNRFLLGMGILPILSAEKNLLPFNPINLPQDSFEPTYLSLPETHERNKLVLNHTGKVFPALRYRCQVAWLGCGLSYLYLSHVSLSLNRPLLTIAEDDVVFPTDFDQRMTIVKKYLGSFQEWDMFSGLMADLPLETKILAVETFMGQTFVIIDRMMSMVFNIYNRSFIESMSRWNVSDQNKAQNTIDQYLKQTPARIVVALPFLVQHLVTANSTLWGHSNSVYSSMISNTESLLAKKAEVSLRRKM